MTDLAEYEGLIHSTAVRYVGFLDDDLDDIKQLLRIKVWQALRAFDPTRGEKPTENFVFSCVRNRVKDLLKEQVRRNRRRNGTQQFVEDAPGYVTVDAFELRYFAVASEEVFADVEDDEVPLPSTLTELEGAVVRLLVLDYNQTEVAALLGVTRQRVRKAQAAVQEKMADWHPTSAAAAAATPPPRVPLAA